MGPSFLIFSLCRKLDTCRMVGDTPFASVTIESPIRRDPLRPRPKPDYQTRRWFCRFTFRRNNKTKRRPPRGILAPSPRPTREISAKTREMPEKREIRRYITARRESECFRARFRRRPRARPLVFRRRALRPSARYLRGRRRKTHGAQTKTARAVSQSAREI